MSKYQTAVNNILYNQPVTAPGSGTAYTALQTDRTINVSATAAFALTLPAPSANNVGQSYIVKDVAGNASTFAITITPASGLIDGAASFSLTVNYGSVNVFSDGTNYWTNAAIKIPSLMPWNGLVASGALAINSAYIVTAGALALSLPTTAALGSVITVMLSTGTSWQITQAASQQIILGNSASTVGVTGYVQSSQTGDAISLVCTVANNVWTAYGAVGNILVN